MTDLLQSMKSATKNNGDREKFDLNETLAIMQMFKEKLKPGLVSDLTGRSVHSLRYKFLEGKIGLKNNKTGEVTEVIRSIKRFKSVKEIYAHFGVEVPDNVEADVKARIEAYKATRNQAV